MQTKQSSDAHLCMGERVVCTFVRTKQSSDAHLCTGERVVCIFVRTKQLSDAHLCAEKRWRAPLCDEDKRCAPLFKEKNRRAVPYVHVSDGCRNRAICTVVQTSTNHVHLCAESSDRISLTSDKKEPVCPRVDPLIEIISGSKDQNYVELFLVR